jgi:hypothetical protein
MLIVGEGLHQVGENGYTLTLTTNDSLPGDTVWVLEVPWGREAPAVYRVTLVAGEDMTWNQFIALGVADSYESRLWPLDPAANPGKWGRVKADGTGIEYVDAPAGSGDVQGPPSATDGNLAVFDGPSGKVIRDGGPPGSGGGTTLHAELTDTDTDGHPSTVITVPGGIAGNAVRIKADGTLEDAGTPPGGTGTTDITVIEGASTVAIQSSSGADDAINAATGTLAGVMIPAQVNDLTAAKSHADISAGNPHGTTYTDVGAEQSGSVAFHDGNTTAHGNKIPTAEQKAAMNAANLPSVDNPFATQAEIDDVTSGYLDKATYDPTSVVADAFSRANHTGTQTLATISDAGNSASRDVGPLSTDVASGDAPAAAVAQHDANASAHGARIPSSTQKAALDSTPNVPDGANPYATIADIAASGGGDMLAATYDPTAVAGDAFNRANHHGTQTLATISDAGNSASRDVGVTALDVAAGDAPGNAVSGHAASVGNHTDFDITGIQSGQVPKWDGTKFAPADSGSSADEKVGISATDTTPDYLQEKLTHPPPGLQALLSAGPEKQGLQWLLNRK